MDALGLVLIPVAAQNNDMFCETIPVSIAPHSYFRSGGPILKREISDIKMICMGGLDTGGGDGGVLTDPFPGVFPGPVSGASRGLGGGGIISCERKSPVSTGSKV